MTARALLIVALLGLAGCAETPVGLRSGIGAGAGAAVAGLTGTPLGWGVTLGIAGGILAGAPALSGGGP